MGKIISFTAIILSCVLLARAEPPTISYTLNGENNGYEYNSNLLNGAYMASKEGHRENADYYTAGNNGQSLTTSRNQGNLEESLRSSSYNAFSPSSHNAGYSEYSSNTRDSLGSSPYLVSNPAQSTFETYTSGSGNGDSTFETYTQGTDQAGSDYNQFASKPKTSTYMRFGDNLSGASSTAAYSELGAESPSFKEYSGDAFRGQTSQREYMNGDQVFSREPSNSFHGSSNDYPYSKQKNSMFGIGGGSKFVNDMQSFHPSETRYVRGNHGTMGSHVYLSSSPNSPFTRGSAGPYSSGKYSKYNKYMGDYTPSGSFNYLSKEQDVDYLLGSYGKGSGKLVPLKETRPSSYGSQAYLPGPSYLSKIIGNYKSKPSFVSYSGSSPAGYSPMSNLHSSFSGSSYADSPLLRRYRSSNYVVPAHTSSYSGYY